MPAPSVTKSPRRAGAPANRPKPGRRSHRLLAELLALNEEMILQLAVELAGGTGTAAFLQVMIAQHEKAAAMLRREIAALPSGTRL